MELISETLGPEVKIGKQYLFVIAVSSYSRWPSLQYPRRDGESLIQLLRQKYYIDEVITLYDGNATKAEIMKQFRTLQETLKPEDSLLIYYAGHGFYDESNNTGFWIPSNAGTDENEQVNWIPNVQIQGFISNMLAHHIFLIIDSCFSGDLLTSYRSKPRTIGTGYYKSAYAKVSRQVITSGNTWQQVPDNSEFFSALLYVLKRNNDPYLTPLAIFEGILRYDIKKTNPLLGYISSSSHETGSSFILFKKPGETGKITISSTMTGTVFLSGNRLGDYIVPGEQVSIEVEEGIYVLEIMYADRRRETREIEILPGEELFVEFNWEGEYGTPSSRFYRFFFSISGAYNSPLYEYRDQFLPHFCGTITGMYRFLHSQYARLLLGIDITGIYHPEKSDTVDYINSIFIIGILTGVYLHVSMPFYPPLELYCGGSFGYGFSFFAHKDLPFDTAVLDDFMAAGNAGIGYSFPHFHFFIRFSYIVVLYENSAALHDINVGPEIGFRF